MAARVLVVGDVMTDYVALLEGPVARGSDRRARIVASPGGSAATQAIWMARFGLGVDFVGRVGARDLERERARFQAAGVTPHLTGDAERETGRLLCLVEPGGERSFASDKGANAALRADDIPAEIVSGADHIQLSGYAFFEASPREAVRGLIGAANGRSVAVDPASAEFLREAGPENFLAWTAGATMLFPNSEEAETLTGSSDPETQGRRLAALYPVVVIKRGAAGCEAWNEGRHWRVAAPRAQALDTTGAGDAFAAGFLAARLGGADMETCLAKASAAGTAATLHVGGRPPD